MHDCINATKKLCVHLLPVVNDQILFVGGGEYLFVKESRITSATD